MDRDARESCQIRNEAALTVRPVVLRVADLRKDEGSLTLVIFSIQGCLLFLLYARKSQNLLITFLIDIIQ